MEGQHSDRVPVTSGVPQGSVLGPCLFLHYINDLPEGIGSTVRLFADDTVMYLTIASQTDSHKLQTDLNNLAKWEKKWQMQFHPDKCQVLRITNKRKPIILNYTLHDHILATVTQAKYLGVTITNDLNWKQHVENITKSANKALGILRRCCRIPRCQVTASDAYRGFLDLGNACLRLMQNWKILEICLDKHCTKLC